MDKIDKETIEQWSLGMYYAVSIKCFIGVIIKVWEFMVVCIMNMYKNRKWCKTRILKNTSCNIYVVPTYILLERSKSPLNYDYLLCFNKIIGKLCFNKTAKLTTAWLMILWRSDKIDNSINLNIQIQF